MKIINTYLEYMLDDMQTTKAQKMNSETSYYTNKYDVDQATMEKLRREGYVTIEQHSLFSLATITEQGRAALEGQK